MKLSARNSLSGVIQKIDRGAVNAEVILEVAPGITIVSIITLDAVKALALKEGEKAYAVIKASSVMIGVDQAVSSVEARSLGRRTHLTGLYLSLRKTSALPEGAP